MTFINLLASFRNCQQSLFLIDNLDLFDYGNTLGSSHGAQSSHSLAGFRCHLSMKFAQGTGKQGPDELELAVETKDPKYVKTTLSLQTEDE